MLCEDVPHSAAAPLSTTGVTIHIVTQWGDDFPLTITSKKLVDDVKASVEKLTGIGRSEQMLVMDGHRLDSSAHLMSLGANENSCIRVYTGKPQTCKMKLRLRSLTADEICINVDPVRAVLECKEIYEKSTGIPPSQQEFVYMGQIMSNDFTLLDYKVVSNSVVHVVFRHFPIFIGTQQHKFYSLRANAKTTILEIKAKIYENAGIEIKEQRLAYKGFEMVDGKDLAYYNAAKPNSVFHLIVGDDRALRSRSDFGAVKERHSDVVKKAPAEHCTVI
ncbi:uncharacterized protein LOC144436358 [Glandiceps talaboti]